MTIAAPAPELVHVDGAGGTRLALDRWPNPGGQRVVLLHGGGQTRHAWGQTAAALAAQGFDVSSADLRGHGDSEWSATGAYTTDDFRDDLAAVIRSVGGPAAVVGASRGGYAALALAGGADKALVAALVLVDITAKLPAGNGPLLAFMRSRPDGFASLDDAADAIAEFMPHRPRPKNPAGLMKNLVARDGRLFWHWDPNYLEVALADHAARPDRLAEDARRVTAPTLLVRGELSELVTEAEAREMQALIPHARVVTVPGARHMVAGEQNSAFGSAVIGFLDEVFAARDAAR